MTNQNINPELPELLELVEEMHRILMSNNSPNSGSEDVSGQESLNIPPGWELWDSQKHSNSTLLFIETVCLADGCAYAPMRTLVQKVNLDLSKQPKELKCWAMDGDGEWFGFEKLPKTCGSFWQPDNGSICSLFPSQYPTNFTDSWENSLIVRPEYWNELCSNKQA